MGLTGGTRATAAAGAGTLLTGTALTLHALARSDPAQALAGLSLTMVALTLIALLFIHHWFTNTSQERRTLADATRKADEERNRYVSLKAALENEHGRLTQAMAEERAEIAERLATERESLRSEFEENRDSLIAETMEVTVRMFRNGNFAPQPCAKGNLIPFPQQQPDRERARGHNVVGP
jgi:Na+/melibiose symporter-like transporter